MKEDLELALRSELEKMAYTAEEADTITQEVLKSWDELEKMASPQLNLFPYPLGAKIFDYAGRVAENAGPQFGKSLGGIGAAALGGAVILGALKAGRAVSASGDYKRFMLAVEQAIKMNQILQHADRNKVVSISESIFKYAPTAGADPHLLSSILSNAVMMDGVDPQVVKSLIDLERGHRDTKAINIASSLAKA